MEDHRWWGWLGLVILFLIIQAWRALFRMARRPDNGTADGGTARMNAAAERILKGRKAAGSNPLPRTKPMGRKPIGTKPRVQTPLPKSATPAVIRRNGLFSAAEEPVIQRRR
jgi:hypothetical protein